MAQRSIEVTIKNQLGMHSRPASIFVKKASSFKSDIQIDKDGDCVNGKSILGILMLAAGYGSNVKIIANGEDAEEALAALWNLVEKDPDFNEDGSGGA